MNTNESKPNSEYRRKAVGRRRLGKNDTCATCGGKEALIAKSKPRICAACQRKVQGKSDIDQHHVAGQNNHPGTVPVPVNDHRAVLSVKQLQWPAETLRNPDQSPLRAIAGCVRGFIDFVEYCIETFLDWIAEALERLDDHLAEKLGPQWWVDTTFGDFIKAIQEAN